MHTLFFIITKKNTQKKTNINVILNCVDVHECAALRSNCWLTSDPITMINNLYRTDPTAATIFVTVTSIRHPVPYLLSRTVSFIQQQQNMKKKISVKINDNLNSCKPNVFNTPSIYIFSFWKMEYLNFGKKLHVWINWNCMCGVMPNPDQLAPWIYKLTHRSKQEASSVEIRWLLSSHLVEVDWCSYFFFQMRNQQLNKLSENPSCYLFFVKLWLKLRI